MYGLRSKIEHSQNQPVSWRGIVRVARGRTVCVTYILVWLSFCNCFFFSSVVSTVHFEGIIHTKQ